MTETANGGLTLSSDPSQDKYDAVVIGSGPNGLAAAITLAEAQHSVLLMEAAGDIGGGTRTRQLTKPGFLHDVCSAVHPLGVCSPFFKNMPLEQYGLQWIHPEASVVHALEPERPVVLYPDMEKTVAGLGADGESYRKLLAPFLESPEALIRQILQPFNPFPKSPILMARFGLRGMASAHSLANRWFQEDAAKGLFAGMAAHSVLPLEQSFTAAVGLMFLVMGHLLSWPIPRGGSQEIAHAMARYFQSLGGEIVINRPIRSLADLPSARAWLFDTTPRALSQITDNVFSASYHKKLNKFRYGPGVFKLDLALDRPIPWQHTEYNTAATVHIGGTFEEVADSERAAWQGRAPHRPFVLVSQQSLFDDSRAPSGQHTCWAYCHVPAGYTGDAEDAVLGQIERFAPGFRDTIIGQHVMNPAAMERHNPNYIGGDITGGVMDIWQLFARPVNPFAPYSTPAENIYICSSSTPPGPGVHGMCGYFAAHAALRRALKA